jgi:hypothetical protein
MPVKLKSLAHDKALFNALLARAAFFNPDIRRGSLFGSPAVYVGRRMAICVHGAELGLRVPEALARKSIEDGRARPFQPYGKAPMREWIALGGGPDALNTSDDLLQAALTFAEANNAK